MNWKKLKKLMREHPQYFDDTILLSEAETTRIMEAHPYTFEDMIRDAKIKTDLPAEAWGAADRVICKKTKRENHRTPIVFHRKLAIAVATIVVLSIFFTLTPIGRTIAENIIQYIVHFFDNSVLLESEKDGNGLSSDTPPDQLPQPVDGEDESKIRMFQTITELKNKTGLNPVYLFVENMKIESINLFIDGDLEKNTSILYSISEGHVSLVQYWTVNASMITQAGKQIESITVLGEYEMVLYEDEYDHSITGFIVFDDSILMITAGAGIDIKGIANYLCKD